MLFQAIRVSIFGVANLSANLVFAIRDFMHSLVGDYVAG
jgi:hypothetical protein